MTSFTFNDTKSGREFRFDGDLLAHVSTVVPGRPRWSEISIFRTEGGQYVLVKTGKSILFHSTRECSRTGKYYVERKRADHHGEAANGIPCLQCGPRANDPIVYEENDLVTVVVSRSAEGVVESAHLEDEDGIMFIPAFVNRALRLASEKDDELKAAFKVEVVR